MKSRRGKTSNTNCPDYDLMKIEFSSGNKWSLFWHRTGWLIILGYSLTLIFLFSSIYLNDPKGLQFEYRAYSQTEAYISWSREVDSNSSNEAIWEYEFIYEVDTTQYAGSSVATDQQLNFENEIQIEYLIKNPQISRIKGLENLALWPFKVTFALLISSFLISLFKYRKILLVSDIISDIAFSVANYSAIRMTIRGIGSPYGDNLYQLKYTYTVEAQEFSTYLTTNDFEEKSDQLEVMYSQSAPSKSILLCALPERLVTKIREELAFEKE